MSCPAVIDVLVPSGPIVVDVVTPGPPGAIGSRWFTGASVPAADLGAVGDYYLRVNGDVYGPKASGWGAVQFTLTGTGGGASLSDSPPQPLGTAAAGTAATASRSDHRHAMPTAAQVGADATGTAAAAVAAHAAAADPHPTYTTGAELASALAGKVDSGDPRLSDAREWSAPTVDQATAEAGVSMARVAYNPLRVFQSIAAWWAASAAKTKLDGIAAGATANSSDATLLARANHTGTQAVDTISGLGTLATQSGTFSGTSSGTNTGDQTSVSGNAGTATKLETPRTIGGSSFDGSANVIAFPSPGAIGGTTPAAGAFTTLSASGNISFSGQFIQSLNGAASTPPMSLSGTWFTGGTSTTTKPQFLVEPAGTTTSNWSTAGTGLGVNAPAGFLGDLAWLGVNGTSAFRVDYTGATLIGANTGVSIATPTFTAVTREQTHGGANDQSASKSLILYNNGGAFRGAYSIVGKNRGSIGGFQALSASDTLGYHAFAGSTATGMFIGAFMRATTVSAWSDTSRETLMQIAVTPANSTTVSVVCAFTANMLMFGPFPAASLPALKWSGTVLQARLSDDSGYATIDALHRLQGAVPATPTSPGTEGDIRKDGSHVYVCIATNTWRRAALSTW